MALRRDLAAINELLNSLEEESISKLALDDGSISFVLQSDEHGEVPVTMVVTDPATYPKSAMMLLSDKAEIPSRELLNEKLSAGCKLTKALRLLGSKLGMDLDWVEEADGEGGGGGGSSYAGSDRDEEMMDADEHSEEEEEEEDADLLREWSKNLTRWEAVERRQEQQEEEEQNKAGNLDALNNRQIFDTRAAFRRLVNEMEEVYKAQDFNLAADARMPDGLYTWDVSLAGFSPGSQLAQDMQQAGRKFGVSSVQLQLRFKRGLHPFYPPSVKLVAPRFEGPMLSALASHPMLTLEGWDPFQPAKEVLLSIKAFLQEHGRVDLESERNRMTGPSGSAYLESEHLLARLEALSGVHSAARVEGHPLFRSHAAPAPAKGGDSPRPPSPKKQKADAAGTSAGTAAKAVDQSVAWAAGTGYGYGHKAGEVWDAKRAAAVQSARDAELQDVLSRLATALSSQLAAPGAPDAAAAADVADCVEAVRRSCLAPLLVNQLCGASFQDMSARHGYYLALLECLDAICTPQTSAVLGWRGTASDLCVAEAMGRVKLQASHFVRVFSGSGAAPASPSGAGGRRTGTSSAQQRQQPQSPPLPGAAAGSGPGPSTYIAAASTPSGSSHEEEQRELHLANYLLAVAKKVEQHWEAAGRRDSGSAGPSTSSAAAAAAGGAALGGRTRGQQQAAAAAAAAAGGSAQGTAADDDAAYRTQMSKLKVRILEGIAASHSFRDAASKENVQIKERLRRVGKELASCESDLPIHPDSSVFVVADETHTCLWKALIIGPKGTPYEGGCFIFDIYFPVDYPRVPPKVQLKTTGGGSVRFNPNLYNCGKVCLSLLGTWQGARGESWDASVSTILQVLVSIQSLILVDEPFYNEPGYEQRASEAQSNAYSANIMEQTVRWAVVDQLRSPPPYFADVIKQHFSLRGGAVAATCRRWAGWCKEKGHARHATAIEKMLPQLEEECRKLS